MPAGYLDTADLWTHCFDCPRKGINYLQIAWKVLGFEMKGIGAEIGKGGLTREFAVRGRRVLMIRETGALGYTLHRYVSGDNESIPLPNRSSSFSAVECAPARVRIARRG